MSTPDSERHADQARELLHGLFDLQFRSILTTRMVPTIYTLGILLSGLLTIYSVISAFERSWQSGIGWLLVFGPALFIACLVILRISLEVILVLFRLLVVVENLEPVVHKISGQTDEIVTDLPRIQFWKNWRRGMDSDN